MILGLSLYDRRNISELVPGPIMSPGQILGWDPKENLGIDFPISVVYIGASYPLFILLKGKTTWCFNLLSVAAVLLVIMTWFGVNYYLSGLHSYGKPKEEIVVIWDWAYLVLVFLSVVCPQTFSRTLCHIFVFFFGIYGRNKMWQII